MDNRSFTLNFEVNAFIYDEGVARSLKQAFINDMKLSNKLTSEEYAERNMLVKFKEGFHNYFLQFYIFARSERLTKGSLLHLYLL